MHLNYFGNSNGDSVGGYPQQACRWHKTGGSGSTPKGCAAIQRDLNRLERRSGRNLNKEMCAVLLLRRNNPRHQDMLGASQLESGTVEKDLGGVLVDTRLVMSQQHAPATKKVSGY